MTSPPPVHPSHCTTRPLLDRPLAHRPSVITHEAGACALELEPVLQPCVVCCLLILEPRPIRTETCLPRYLHNSWLAFVWLLRSCLFHDLRSSAPSPLAVNERLTNVCTQNQRLWGCRGCCPNSYSPAGLPRRSDTSLEGFILWTCLSSQRNCTPEGHWDSSVSSIVWNSYVIERPKLTAFL